MKSTNETTGGITGRTAYYDELGEVSVAEIRAQQQHQQLCERLDKIIKLLSDGAGPKPVT